MSTDATFSETSRMRCFGTAVFIRKAGTLRRCGGNAQEKWLTRKNIFSVNIVPNTDPYPDMIYASVAGRAHRSAFSKYLVKKAFTIFGQGNAM